MGMVFWSQGINKVWSGLQITLVYRSGHHWSPGWWGDFEPPRSPLIERYWWSLRSVCKKKELPFDEARRGPKGFFSGTWKKTFTKLIYLLREMGWWPYCFFFGGSELVWKLKIQNLSLKFMAPRPRNISMAGESPGRLPKAMAVFLFGRCKWLPWRMKPWS